jgi:polysaccharide biosynthesis/export protein
MTTKTLAFLFLFIVMAYPNVPVLYCEEPKEHAGVIRDFLLGPEDVLEITAWKNEDLTRQVVVRPDGKISFPLIGDVVAQGRTVDELKKIVEDKIRILTPDVPVTVMVMQVGSQKVYVVGKVAKPGVYMMGKPLRVMQALAMAGGTTPFAKNDDILIIRDENGQQNTFRFRYSDVAEGEDLKQNILLNAGDTVVVP